VSWETDVHNEPSQKAIERIGPKREGVLRAHRIRPDGTLRDTVVYSLTAPEWHDASKWVIERLAR
jgi:RimJ/RimL family protein N-acetyltransferase